MATVPYLTQNYDPRTGLPRGKKKPFSGSFTGSLAGGTGFGGGLIPGVPGSAAFQPSGGGPITTPGFTPDYKSLISQALGPLSAQLTAEGSADVSSRNSALIRGMAQFGEQFDPASAQAAFGQDFYNQAGMGDLLGQANALAAENTKAGFSFKARSQSAFEKGVQQIRDALAARGMLRSGATGVALQGAQKEFDQGQYDARQQLVDYSASVQQGYVAGQRARQTQLDSAQREEAGRQAQLNPATGSQTLQYSGQNATDGRPLYQGPNGLVFADGTPYTPAPGYQQSEPQSEPQSVRVGHEIESSGFLEAVRAELARRNRRTGGHQLLE